MGLAIAYSIIKNHGGSIAVESRVGAGTTFHLHLPASEQSLKNEKPSLETLSRGMGRVLIMDDEELIRSIACKMLTHLGYQVTATSDGEEAIAVYRQSLEAGKKFDAVILDLTIPEAWEARRRLAGCGKSILALRESSAAVIPRIP